MNMNEDVIKPSWAIAETDGTLCIGAQLATIDGRKVGNAVISRQMLLGSVNDRRYISDDAVCKESPFDFYWEVITDIGNKLLLTDKEVQELFYPPRWVMDLSQHPRLLSET